MKILRPGLLLALILPVVALAESYPRAPMKLKLKPYQVDTRDYNFPSGLRVLFQSDRSQPIVAVTSFIDHGSSSDPVGLEGIAHCVEHMWFRSRHPLPDGSLSPKIWDILRDVGGNLNASTAADWTNYMTVAPREQLTTLMRLEGLRLLNAVNAVENDVLLVEREVIRNELRMRYENGGAAAFEYLFAKLFPTGHPYSRLGIGTHDSLNAITLKDVQKFVKDYYRPEHTTITVVGDFSLDESSSFLNELPLELLADPANPSADIALVKPTVRVSGPAVEPPAPPQPVLVKGETEGISVEHGAVDYPTIVVGWSLPSGYRKEDIVAQMAAVQVGNGMVSEMFPSWAWANEDQPIKEFGCGADAQKHSTYAFCWIGLRPDQDAVEIADRALNGLYRAWIADETLRKFQEWNFQYSRASFMAGLFRDVDNIASISGRATNVSAFAHYTGSTRYYSDQFEMLNQVNADMVRKYAEKYLNRTRAVAVVMLPYEDGDIDIATGNAVYRGSRRDGPTESALPDAMLTPESIAKMVTPVDTKTINTSKLANGIGVTVMPYSNAPLVEVAVKFRGGHASFDWGKGRFADEMRMYDGALDELAIAGSAYSGMSDHNTVFHVTASAGNLADAMYFLRDRIDHLVPYTNGRIDWIKQLRVQLKYDMLLPEFWESVVRNERRLPNHFISRWYDDKDFDAMNTWGVDVSRDVWKRILRPENADIFVVGNIDAEEAKQAARTYFGAWSGWGEKPKDWVEPDTDYKSAGDPPKRQVILFNKDQSSQTSVRYTCQLESITDDGNPLPTILAGILSEGAWLALREQTGASYGAGAGAGSLPGGITTLNMSVLVQNDTAAGAVKAFLDLGERAKAGRIDSRLANIVKFNDAQLVVQGHQSVSQTMDTLLGAWDVRDGYGYWDTYGQKLGNVSAAQMSTMMTRCVGHEIVSMVGPQAIVEPQLKSAGLPYEVFDWKQAAKDYRAVHKIKEPKVMTYGKK